MAFLDDIDKKITLWGQGAIQKTKEVSDTAKLSNAIRILESQKKDCFTEIGKAYYSECAEKEYFDHDNYVSMVNHYVKEIQKINIEIQEKKDFVSQIKGVVYCTNCNAEIPRNSSFCNNCGTKVQYKPKVSKGKQCVQCGAELEENQVFCSNCGKKVESQENIVVVTEVEEKRCVQCGAILKDTQSFCTTCGTKVHIVEATEEILPSPNNICPKCGVQVEEDSMFCTECGCKLDDGDEYNVL